MYKVKHLKTGLFFQPYKARKTSLSVKGGKIYQTDLNCLNTNLRDNGFYIYCHRGSTVHLDTKSKLDWQKVDSVYADKLQCWTDVSEWKLQKV